ncbi:hypothetical protein DFS34DRAFT_470842 [Phlyctochytrium arcticum]|nr:hypothetical protein DFS34DRAFT_470842 [Phlyctochytrium arcticum]
MSKLLLSCIGLQYEACVSKSEHVLVTFKVLNPSITCCNLDIYHSVHFLRNKSNACLQHIFLFSKLILTYLHLMLANVLLVFLMIVLSLGAGGTYLIDWFSDKQRSIYYTAYRDARDDFRVALDDVAETLVDDIVNEISKIYKDERDNKVKNCWDDDV